VAAARPGSAKPRTHFWDAATAAGVPENARLFAREFLETKEKQHTMWKV
jgi:hypothetical protein